MSSPDPKHEPPASREPRPATYAEKAAAFEWLRNLGLSVAAQGKQVERMAYVILAELCRPGAVVDDFGLYKGRAKQSLWKCECGASPSDNKGDWRWSGYSWQHHHGYPIGHVDAEFQGFESPVCVWSYDDSEDKWEGHCGAAWQFTDGGPTENEMRFCPGCGRHVEVKRE